MVSAAPPARLKRRSAFSGRVFSPKSRVRWQTRRITGRVLKQLRERKILRERPKASKETLSRLIRISRNQQGELSARIRAVHALGETRDPKAAPYLSQLIRKDPEFSIRIEAIGAIQKMRGKNNQSYLHALYDPVRAVQIAAVRGARKTISQNIPPQIITEARMALRGLKTGQRLILLTAMASRRTERIPWNREKRTAFFQKWKKTTQKMTIEQMIQYFGMG